VSVGVGLKFEFEIPPGVAEAGHRPLLLIAALGTGGLVDARTVGPPVREGEEPLRPLALAACAELVPIAFPLGSVPRAVLALLKMSSNIEGKTSCSGSGSGALCSPLSEYFAALLFSALC
jgi:hypothetical protein